jgi:hypothetical protein
MSVSSLFVNKGITLPTVLSGAQAFQVVVVGTIQAPVAAAAASIAVLTNSTELQANDLVFVSNGSSATPANQLLGSAGIISAGAGAGQFNLSLYVGIVATDPLNLNYMVVRRV